MHPVGPRPSGVYWVRRTVVVVVAVALVIGLVWWLAGRGGDSADVDRTATTTPTTPSLTGVLAAPTVSDDIFDSPAVDDTSVDDTATDDAADDGTGPVTITGTGDDESAPSTGADGATSETASSDDGPASTTGSAAATSKTKPEKGTPSGTADGDTTASDDDGPATTGGTSTPKTTSPGQDKPKDKPKRTSTETTPPPPSYDSAGRLMCADSSISVAAITWSDSYPVGSQPRLGMAVTNVGTEACVRDLSGTLQTYTVYTAAGDRVWSTDDCFPGEGHEVRLLTPGSTANYIIKWAGTTSEPGCAAPRVPVKAGKYVLVAKLGHLKSKKHVFTMR